MNIDSRVIRGEPIGRGARYAEGEGCRVTFRLGEAA